MLGIKAKVSDNVADSHLKARSSYSDYPYLFKDTYNRSINSLVYKYSLENAGKLAIGILPFFIISIFIACSTRQFLQIFNADIIGLPGYGISYEYSALVVFTLDTICVSVLVCKTGGARESPFTSFYTLILTLAILLRESFSRFMYYSVILAIAYSYSFFKKSTLNTNKPKLLITDPDYYNPSWFNHTNWLMTIMTGILAGYIGWKTRPM